MPQSRTALAAIMSARQYDLAANHLPATIPAALEMEPISVMARYIDPIHIQRTIEVLLAQLAGRITTGGNLSPSMVEFIAAQLMAQYPNEVLGDFKIAFDRGAMGGYGPVFRLDGAVIGDWMGKYLSEKYEAVERTYEARKAMERNIATPPAEPGPGYAEFTAWAKSLNDEMNARMKKAEATDGPRYKRSPEEIAKIAADQDARILEGRRRYYKERYPTASEDEINQLVNQTNTKP